MRSSLVALVVVFTLPIGLDAQKPRERDINLPIGGTPGPLDAITDVAGVEVGHTTLISGGGKLVVGKGPVRTGVTVIHPRGKANSDPVFAAWFTLNGNGEMTGTTWLQESGIFIAFSTANARAWFNDQPVTDVKMLPNDRISPLFQATAQATEAAITNALLAAETMTGANDLRIYAMPVDRLREVMRKYGRLP